MAEAPYTISSISTLLENLGYRAKVDDDLVESATSGMNFYLRLSDDFTIQFSLGVQNQVGFDSSEVNMFNKKYRYGKLYIGESDDLVLEFDFLFGLDLESTFERGMLIWDSLVSALVREVQNKALSTETPRDFNTGNG